MGHRATLQAIAILSEQRRHEDDGKEEATLICSVEKKKRMDEADDQAAIDLCIISEFLTAMCSNSELTKDDPNMLVLACVHGLGHVLSQVRWLENGR